MLKMQALPLQRWIKCMLGRSAEFGKAELGKAGLGKIGTLGAR
jgi:hypothetical protein